MGRLPDEQKPAATATSVCGENCENSSSRPAHSSSKAPFPEPPPCFGLGQLTRHNAMQLKQLHLATLPVTYGDTLYENLQRHSEFSRLGYLGEVMVGAICCRVEAPSAPAPGEKKKHRLYIMTLSVLKPYRRYGVASGLLSYVLSRASQPPEAVSVELEDCYLHVWTENKYALEFYEKRGFVNEGIQEDYYTDVSPPSAYILRAPLPWVYADPKFASRDADDYDVTQHNLVTTAPTSGSK